MPGGADCPRTLTLYGRCSVTLIAAEMAAIVNAHPCPRQCATIFVTSESIAAVGWRRIALDALNGSAVKT
jgi:hypothetical protein